MNSLPPVRVPYPTVTVSDDVLGGSPLVTGTRVPVRRIWAWHRKGVTVETLVRRYPSLGWEKVLGALAFAHANEDLVEADLDRERAILDVDPTMPPVPVPVIPGIALGPPPHQSGDSQKDGNG